MDKKERLPANKNGHAKWHHLPINHFSQKPESHRQWVVAADRSFAQVIQLTHEI